MAGLDEVIGAVRHDDDAAAQRWFRLLCAAEQNDARGAAEIVAGLREHDAPSAEALERTLTSIADPDEALRAVRDLGPDAALARYHELVGVPEDPAAWQAFLAEKGPFWDGNEENWQAFREWFAYEGDQAGLGSVTAAFLRYVEASGDKRTAFAEYGVSSPAADQQDVTPPDGYEDPAAWQAFLAEKGPFWDGNEENWQAFREWFAYEAGQAGVPRSATSFLDHAESTGDRAAVFATYGVPIRSGASEEAGPPSASPSSLTDHLEAVFADNRQALGTLSDAEIDELARKTAEALLADQS